MKLFSRLCLLGMVCLHGALGVPSARAQAGAPGSLFGQVTEAETARELTNVVVRVMGSGLQVRSGSDGRYSILGLESGSYDVEFALAGYNLQTLRGVPVRPGEATRLDVTLALELFELPLLEVMADPLEDFDQALLLDRMQSNVSFDGLSSERMAQIGVGDAAEALAKVPGTTIVEGKFAVIRGLNDRYTLASLNGAEIPSADPYRKAAQLDLFPSDMIEQVVVNKTFTPDQPGGFTGGSIDLITKSFPEKFGFSVSASTAFNTQSSLNEDFFSYPGGSLDWLALDDGTRSQPAELVPGATLTPDQINDNINVNFGPSRSRAPLDHGLAVSLGDTVKLAEQPLGYFVGLNYSRKFTFYEDGVSGSYRSGPPDNLQPSRLLTDSRGVEEAAWSAVMNLAYEPLENHEISFTFAYLQSSEDEARRRQGVDYSNFQENTVLDMSTLHWTERNLNTFQLRGEHELPSVRGLRVDWLASIANTSQEEPDLRYINFYSVQLPDGTGLSEIGNSALPSPPFPSRFWRNLAEQNENFKLDGTLPFQPWSELEGKLKVGGFYSRAQRESDETTFRYGTSPTAFFGDPITFPNDFLTRPELNTLGFQYLLPNVAEGTLEVVAGYAMIELPLVEQLRFVGGARYEVTDLVNDVTTVGQPSQSGISQADVLPAAGLIYGVTPNMNVRLNYSQTIARPTFREITPISTYDSVGDFEIRGNASLEMSDITNYDLRWEWFPRPGEVIAVSGFYKELIKPIEKVLVSATGDIITFENRPGVTELFGVELEFRKTLDFVDPLLADFSLGGNLAWIQSEVPFTEAELIGRRANDPSVGDTRPLFDQSPYVINADLTYDNRRSGTLASAVFNLAGERIFFTVDGGPDVYEQPFPQLDLIFSQRLWTHWKVKLSVKNVLDSEFKRTYSSDFDSPFLNAQYRKGRTFGFTLSYNF